MRIILFNPIPPHHLLYVLEHILQANFHEKSIYVNISPRKSKSTSSHPNLPSSLQQVIY